MENGIKEDEKRRKKDERGKELHRAESWVTSFLKVGKNLVRFRSFFLIERPSFLLFFTHIHAVFYLIFSSVFAIKCNTSYIESRHVGLCYTHTVFVCKCTYWQMLIVSTQFVYKVKTYLNTAKGHGRY